MCIATWCNVAVATSIAPDLHSTGPPSQFCYSCIFPFQARPKHIYSSLKIKPRRYPASTSHTCDSATLPIPGGGGKYPANGWVLRFWDHALVSLHPTLHLMGRAERHWERKLKPGHAVQQPLSLWDLFPFVSWVLSRSVGTLPISARGTAQDVYATVTAYGHTLR